MVRLSQLAEANEEINPKVVELIDAQISEISNRFAQDMDSPQLDKNMFPPITTPMVNVEGDGNMQENTHLDQIVDEIKNSPEFQEAMSSNPNVDKRDVIERLVQQKLDKMFGRRLEKDELMQPLKGNDLYDDDEEDEEDPSYFYGTI